jgi:hypothetical protein
VSKRTDSPGFGSLASGALTATSLLLVTGVAAAIGIVIAREFGRSDETDGLVAAYAVFIVIAIAGQAIRVAVLPELARARLDNRLAGSLAGLAVALAVVAVPVLLVAELGASWVAGLLTGDESEVARETAADVLRWVVPAAVAHLFAALAASGLAALDDYGTAAFGYALGSAASLALILLRVDSDGIIAIAWGMALNGAIAMLVPVAALGLRAAREQVPRAAVRPTGPPLPKRLGTFAVGAALPLALQLLYVLCVPFASRLGEGEATSFFYAYLAGSALVTVTAGSLGIVTSAPLARLGSSLGDEAARHVVATSWLALAIVGVAAGAFALAGENVVEAVLGGAYGGDVGADLGRLVVAFSPWIVASIGVSLSFPLAFVAGRTRGLPWIALAVVVLQLPLAWAGASWLELDGLALALAVLTLLVLAALLVELKAFAIASRQLTAAAVVVAAVTLAAFVPPALLLGSVAEVVVGIVLYVALFALVRPRGLLTSWRYLRALS